MPKEIISRRGFFKIAGVFTGSALYPESLVPKEELWGGRFRVGEEIGGVTKSPELYDTPPDLINSTRKILNVPQKNYHFEGIKLDGSDGSSNFGLAWVKSGGLVQARYTIWSLSGGKLISLDNSEGGSIIPIELPVVTHEGFVFMGPIYITEASASVTRFIERNSGGNWQLNPPVTNSKIPLGQLERPLRDFLNFREY